MEIIIMEKIIVVFCKDLLGKLNIPYKCGLYFKLQ